MSIFCLCLFPLDWIPHSSLFRPNKLTIVSFHSSCHHNFEECGNAAAKNDHFIQKLLQFIWYVHTAYLQGFFSKTTIAATLIHISLEHIISSMLHSSRVLNGCSLGYVLQVDVIVAYHVIHLSFEVKIFRKCLVRSFFFIIF